MKITCNRTDFLAAFTAAANVAPPRSPKPILQNVKLEANGSAVLTATDMEIGIRIQADGVEIGKPGVVVLPAAKVAAILRETSDETLTFEIEKGALIVKGAGSRFRLPTANAEEFPAVAEEKAVKCHKIKATALKEILRRTLFATDDGSSRYALGGILLEFEEDKIIAVGSDGRRLACASAEAKQIRGHDGTAGQTIAPGKALKLLLSILPDDDEAVVQVSATSSALVVKSEQVQLRTRLVEGRFPKWRDVIPTREAKQVELPVGEVHKALRMAAIATNDESRGVDFRLAENVLTLAAVAQEVGSSKVETALAYEGDKVQFTLDHRFVADMLKVVDSDSQVKMEFEDENGAVVFLYGDNYQYVVMPLAKEG